MDWPWEMDRPSLMVWSIGRRIRFLREQSGWSAQHAADQIGMPREVWTRYEISKYLPTLAAVEKICGLFRIQIREIFEPDCPVRFYLDDFTRQVVHASLLRLTAGHHRLILEVVVQQAKKGKEAITP